MKIRSVESIALRYQLPQPMADALNWFDSRAAVLVRIHTNEGLTGIGESAYFGGPMSTTQHIVEEELAPLLVGQSPLDIEKLWSRMYHRSMQHGRHGAVISAMGGIDIALWDLLGKINEAPVYRLLGAFRNVLPTYASGGFYYEGQSASDLAEELESYVRRGFRAVKFKVGRNPDVPMNPLRVIEDRAFAFHTPEEDLERVAEVRKKLGTDIQIMVDANSGWDVATTLRMLPALERAEVAWLEEPLFPEDTRGSARIQAASSIPIAGYETIQGRFGYRDLLVSGAVGIVQPDATWSGGITECRRIASLASAFNLPCAPHSFGSSVALHANAHLLASLPNGLVLEIDQTPNPLRDQLTYETITIDAQGSVSLSGKPGLGITLDENVVDQYRVG